MQKSSHAAVDSFPIPTAECIGLMLNPKTNAIKLPKLFQEMMYISFKLFIRSCTMKYCVFYVYVKSSK